MVALTGCSTPDSNSDFTLDFTDLQFKLPGYLSPYNLKNIHAITSLEQFLIRSTDLTGFRSQTLEQF
jgi:hypothetical protein